MAQFTIRSSQLSWTKVCKFSNNIVFIATKRTCYNGIFKPMWKHANVFFFFLYDFSCRWMTDFLEKSILLEGLRGTFPNKKTKVKDDMVLR